MSLLREMQDDPVAFADQLADATWTKKLKATGEGTYDTTLTIKGLTSEDLIKGSDTGNLGFAQACERRANVKGTDKGGIKTDVKGSKAGAIVRRVAGLPPAVTGKGNAVQNASEKEQEEARKAAADLEAARAARAAQVNGETAEKK